jgi:hypothetical protein
MFDDTIYLKTIDLVTKTDLQMTLTFIVKLFKTSSKNFNYFFPLKGDRLLSYLYTLFLVIGTQWHYWLQRRDPDPQKRAAYLQNEKKTNIPRTRNKALKIS